MLTNREFHLQTGNLAYKTGFSFTKRESWVTKGILGLLFTFGSYKPYNEFQKDFPEIEESGVKIYTDKDGFQYSVSVPDYLLWNGNLAIAESDVRYALIIWIKPFHQGISQGVLFNDYKDLNTQIMLSSSKKAEDQEDQWIVDENSTILTTIFEKANKVWNLGLK